MAEMVDFLADMPLLINCMSALMVEANDAGWRFHDLESPPISIPSAVPRSEIQLSKHCCLAKLLPAPPTRTCFLRPLLSVSAFHHLCRWWRRRVIISSIVTKTSSQCLHKMEKLRKRYKTEKQRGLARPNCVFASSWIFFNLMDSMEAESCLNGGFGPNLGSRKGFSLKATKKNGSVDKGFNLGLPQSSRLFILSIL